MPGIDLGPEAEEYLASLVASGRYPSRAEALAQALILLSEHEEKEAELQRTRHRAALRAALDDD